MPPASCSSAAIPSSPLADPVSQLVREESERLRRFVLRQVGNSSDADEITQQGLRRDVVEL